MCSTECCGDPDSQLTLCWGPDARDRWLVQLGTRCGSCGVCATLPAHPCSWPLDLPTGLNADTGEVDPACPRFDVTLALGYPKVGLLRFPGVERAGRLQVLDIGVPVGLREERAVDIEVLTPQWVGDRLPQRPLDSHKGTYGHSLVVAGSRQYVGAAWLASQASVRTGAGLTTLASPEGVYAFVAAKGAEAIHLPLSEDDEGANRGHRGWRCREV